MRARPKPGLLTKYARSLAVPLPAAGAPFSLPYVITQISLIQSGFYTIYAVVLLLLDVMFMYRPTLDQIFLPSAFSLSRAESIVPIIAMVAASALTSYLVRTVVERSRLCLDFVITLFTIHIIACAFYSHSFPHNFAWWLFVGFSTLSLTLLSESLCYRRETAEAASVNTLVYNPLSTFDATTADGEFVQMQGILADDANSDTGRSGRPQLKDDVSIDFAAVAL